MVVVAGDTSVVDRGVAVALPYGLKAKNANA
jgi:hypothetical protein